MYSALFLPLGIYLDFLSYGFILTYFHRMKDVVKCPADTVSARFFYYILMLHGLAHKISSTLHSVQEVYSCFLGCFRSHGLSSLEETFIFISWRLITLQYCSGFCHTLT